LRVWASQTPVSIDGTTLISLIFPEKSWSVAVSNSDFASVNGGATSPMRGTAPSNVRGFPFTVATPLRSFVVCMRSNSFFVDTLLYIDEGFSVKRWTNPPVHSHPLLKTENQTAVCAVEAKGVFVKRIDVLNYG
jgi:hypothetical protein